MNGPDAADAALPPASGPPQALTIEGILDGRLADEPALRAAADALGACHAGRFRLEITGGRFNLLPEETQVPAAGFDQDAQAAFLQALQQVVAAAVPGSVETTLRCRLVWADQVAETLFVLRGSELQPLTRRRPRQGGEAPPLQAGRPRFRITRRELLWIAPLLLLAALLTAWRSGFLDRLLAARAETLQRDTGPFADMLELDAERAWGNYEVALRRGAGYPATPADLAQRRDASADLVARAAVEVVGSGGEVFVQLRDDQGQLLAEGRVELRPLLGSVDGRATLQLPGRMSAHAVRLALQSGKEGK